jgi:hypothetical protein
MISYNFNRISFFTINEIKLSWSDLTFSDRSKLFKKFIYYKHFNETIKEILTKKGAFPIFHKYLVVSRNIVDKNVN